MQLLTVDSVGLQESGQVESDYDSRSDSYSSEKDPDAAEQNSQVCSSLVSGRCAVALTENERGTGVEVILLTTNFL